MLKSQFSFFSHHAMPYDPFAALCEAAELGGVACSLDAADAPDIIVLDGQQDSTFPGTDGGASEAVATQKKNTASPENPRKRKQPKAAAKTAARRKYDADKHLKLTPLPPQDGAHIKTVFVPIPPKKKTRTASTDASFALALWPQFGADWSGADFGDRTWLVLSSQSPWFSQMIRTAIPKAKREAVAGVFLLAKQEFSVGLSKKRLHDP